MLGWDITAVALVSLSVLYMAGRWLQACHLRPTLRYDINDMRWLERLPVSKTVVGGFAVSFGLSVIILGAVAAANKDSIETFHIALAGLGSWVVAWCFCLGWLCPRLKFKADEYHRMSGQVCPRDLAIQEVDLLSSLCSMVALLVSFVLFVLDWDKDSAIRTWEATTVWPNASNATCNRSGWSVPAHTCATAAVQTALGHSCGVANAAPELYVGIDTWNGTAFESFVVGAPSQMNVPFLDWPYAVLLNDQWYAVMWVLVVNAFFQVERAVTNKAVSESSCPYDPEAPDSSRWTEYVLTSPLQVFLVAVSVGTRQDDVLWLLMACQALLILLGLLIEVCMYLQTLPEPNTSCGTASTTPRLKADVTMASRVPHYAPYQYPAVPYCVPYTPVPYKPGLGLQAAPYTLVHAQELRLGCSAGSRASNSTPASTPAVPFRPSWWYTAGLVFTGFWWHFMIWKVLIVAFNRAAQQFEDCNSQEVPPWIIWLLYVQLSLFTLFGVVQAWMVYAVGSNRRHKEYDFRCIWQTGTLLYSVLSVTAKLALDVLFIAGTAARE